MMANIQKQVFYHLIIQYKATVSQQNLFDFLRCLFTIPMYLKIIYFFFHYTSLPTERYWSGRWGCLPKINNVIRFSLKIALFGQSLARVVNLREKITIYCISTFLVFPFRESGLSLFYSFNEFKKLEIEESE